MARHNELGKQGEVMATVWLISKGYDILENNWRFGKLEIDIIACKENTLHFIEVKTRSSSRFGHPEELVTRKKMIRFIHAGSAYHRMKRSFRRVRYNILSVTLFQGMEPSFFLIEDVYL